MFIGYLQDKVVSMAFLLSLKNTQFVLLAYIAIDKKFQGRGIGSSFMKNLLDVIRNDSMGQYLLMEVENPRYGDNREEKERRVQFYKRLGTKEMKGLKYVFPPLPGEKTIEMILMVMPDYNNGKMEGDLVKQLITQIYVDVYGRSKNDNLLKSLIDKIPLSIDLI